jgi:signal transduction histidine kinase
MDPQQMQQVLFNLVINARQATGAGGRVWVRTSANPVAPSAGAMPCPGCVEVCVRDDGPGIPPEKHAEIFKPFYTTKNQGTGLGLPISRKIVEAHGGRLHVESRVGEGATFYVWLPRERSTT